MPWSWEISAAPAHGASISLDGALLAALEPVSPYFEPAPCEVATGRAYTLSRFALMRVDGGRTILECPLSHARIVLHDWRAAALVHLLAVPRPLGELCAGGPSLPLETASSLLSLLLAAGMLVIANDGETTPTAEPDTLRTWEFHDLLFHARSRAGRHANPTGGTYRFFGQIEPPPAMKAASAGPGIQLYRPDLEKLEREDPPFARVQEARRSIREYRARPLTAQQLGEFLYRVGRVADYWDIQIPTPGGVFVMPSAPRPYPSGGGLYELDLFVVVNRCDGVEPGLYYYNPDGHGLDRMEASPEDVGALLQDASYSTTIARDRLQVLIVIAARFQRIAWKYASMAYATILKDTGVLYQTMYLAATAMGLAPCGVGCGNADLFARAIDADYYAETSVGEFLLGSR